MNIINSVLAGTCSSKRHNSMAQQSQDIISSQLRVRPSFPTQLNRFSTTTDFQNNNSLGLIHNTNSLYAAIRSSCRDPGQSLRTAWSAPPPPNSYAVQLKLQIFKVPKPHPMLLLSWSQGQPRKHYPAASLPHFMLLSHCRLDLRQIT